MNRSVSTTTARVVAAVTLALACGCGTDRQGSPGFFSHEDDQDLAGLYTPGSRIGYAAPAVGADAGMGALSAQARAEIEDSIEQAGMQNRCVALPGEPGSDASLTIAFETDSYDGFYAPANCGAVWIEDPDGRYVATADIWAALRMRNLFIWQARRCTDDAPDVISSATLEAHQKHEAVWDGRDVSGAIAPDGRYVLNIEVTEDELDYGRRTQVPFDKGKDPWSLEPDDTETVRGLSLRYEPAVEATP